MSATTAVAPNDQSPRPPLFQPRAAKKADNHLRHATPAMLPPAHSGCTNIGLVRQRQQQPGPPLFTPAAAYDLDSAHRTCDLPSLKFGVLSAKYCNETTTAVPRHHGKSSSVCYVGYPVSMSFTISRSDSLHDRPEGLAFEDLTLDRKSYAYITLLTRSTYLAGVLLLAHGLRKHGSRYPLIVLYTPTLEPVALRALQLESARSNIILKLCELLVPAKHHRLNVAVERFNDTWTKLRAFEIFEDGYDTICYLDVDMLVLQNMDIVFELVGAMAKDFIAAVHDCVCSPDKMPWTPRDYTPENCPFTAQRHPEALTRPISAEINSRRTYQLFNSGMFLYHPSAELWKEMIHFFTTTELLSTFKFPDQDFMTHFFHGRWSPLSWKYNAVKTMAYRHENLWRDEEIVSIHYIIDKPWAKRIDADGLAGLKGLDGRTHSWWWDEYEAWSETRQIQGEMEVVATLSKHVARRDSENSDIERPDLSPIGAKGHDSEGGDGRGSAREFERQKSADTTPDVARHLA